MPQVEEQIHCGDAVVGCVPAEEGEEQEKTCFFPIKNRKDEFGVLPQPGQQFVLVTKSTGPMM